MKRRTFKKSTKKRTVPFPKSPCQHEFCHQAKSPHQQESPLVFNESLVELINSVANIENALANAINAVCFRINQDNLAIEESLQLINNLEEVLNLTININIILDFLIEDVNILDNKKNSQMLKD